MLCFRSHWGVCTKPGGRRHLCRPRSLAVGQPRCARHPTVCPGTAAAGESSRHTETERRTHRHTPRETQTPETQTQDTHTHPETHTHRDTDSTPTRPSCRTPVSTLSLVRIWAPACGGTRSPSALPSGAGRGWGGERHPLRGRAALTPGTSSLGASVSAAMGLGAEQGCGSTEGRQLTPGPGQRGPRASPEDGLGRCCRIWGVASWGQGP